MTQYPLTTMSKWRTLLDERNLCGQPLVRIALGAFVAFLHPLPSIWAVFCLAHCMYCIFHLIFFAHHFWREPDACISFAGRSLSTLTFSYLRSFCVVSRGLIFSCGVFVARRCHCASSERFAAPHTRAAPCTSQRLYGNEIVAYGCWDTRGP